MLDNVELYLQDLEKRVDIDEKFDVIVLSEVIENLSPTVTASVLNNLHSICDGYVIITTPNIHYLRYRLELLFGKDVFDTPIIDEDVGHYEHIYLFSME